MLCAFDLTLTTRDTVSGLHNVLFSAAPLSSYGLMSMSHGFIYRTTPSLIWASSFLAAFYFSCIIVFFKELCLLMMCPK